MTTPSDLASLPDNAVLLHIGPHKTGTTAIQEALAASRDQLRAAGVSYPGWGNQHSRPAMAVLGLSFGFKERGGGGFPLRDWRQLVSQTRQARGRVVISSEFFSMAQPEQARQVVAELNRERVHVVVTLRPLSRILPSSWQQALKSGRTRRYPGWLKQTLSDAIEERERLAFWERHDHGRLVERWSEAAGADRVKVAVLDDHDHSWLYHVFEQLLGLQEDFLLRPAGDRANRSMSALECELLRRVNKHVAHYQVPWADYQAVIRDGAIRRILTVRDPAPDEGKISTPDWALARAAEFGSDAAARIRATGVHVVGDLDRLSEHPAVVPPATLPSNAELRLMVQLVVGALSGSMRRGEDFGEIRRGWPPARPSLDAVNTRHLVHVLRRRIAEQAQRRIPLVRSGRETGKAG